MAEISRRSFFGLAAGAGVIAAGAGPQYATGGYARWASGGALIGETVGSDIFAPISPLENEGVKTLKLKVDVDTSEALQTLRNMVCKIEECSPYLRHERQEDTCPMSDG